MAQDFLDPQFEPEFPGIVRAAGTIWIVNGGIIQVLNLVVLGIIFLTGGPGEDEAKLILAGVSVFFLVAGSLLIYVGIESVIGKARDTLTTWMIRPNWKYSTAAATKLPP